ncbi:Mex67 protein [Martiniozyma asiatica (nom. inval.)]|nr:Mex67 protein [Martiniozyma asiatica]
MYRGGRGGRGRGNYRNTGGSHYNNQNNNNQNNSNFNDNFITLEITGWDNATQNDLVGFLSRKTRVQLLNVQTNGRILQGQVRNERDANDLVKATGIRFASQTLNIRIVDLIGNSGSSTHKVNTIDLLRQLLRQRYNSNMKMLDLTNLINDQMVVSNGLLNNNSMSSKFFTALMKVAEQEKLILDSVNLSMNNLDDHTRWVSELAVQFPNVKNLALSGNNIKKIEFFDRLKSKLTVLRELIIQGNPISQDVSSLKRIVQMFPRLVIIDGNQVRDEQKLSSILNFPIKAKHMFFENDSLQNAATDFINSFLNCWDNNRMDLMQLYTQQSQFSYQLDTSSVADSTSINISQTSWNNYSSQSRNLKKVSQERSRMQRLAIGQEAISKFFLSLPQTRHNIQQTPQNYSIETLAYPPLNGMMVILHGEFEEIAQPHQPFQEKNVGGGRRNQKITPKLQKRSFDRTWIIVPGGSGMLVVSDLLMVRNYCANKGWINESNNSQSTGATPLSSSVPTPAPTPTPTLTPPGSAPGSGLGSSILPTNTASNSIVNEDPRLATLNPIQKELVMKVGKETNLKLDFVLMLCEQSGWNYDVAGQNFMASRANIPMDAFN